MSWLLLIGLVVSAQPTEDDILKFTQNVDQAPVQALASSPISFFEEVKPQESFGFEEESSSDLFQSGALALLFVLAVGFGGVILIKLRRPKGLLKQEQSLMSVISVLHLSPKRQIYLIDVQGHRMTLASTEQGLTFLSDLPKHRPQQNALSQNPETNLKKHSETLLRSLKEQKRVEEKAPSSGTPAFPKYLADSFKNVETQTRPEASMTSEALDNNVQTVTNLIKEKIKSMKTLDKSV